MPARVIHLHPSRFCNLACKHCYSASGPQERLHLPPAQVIAALEVLRGEGYDVLSLSGGEPTLYSGFEQIVRSAASLGFQVNLISNGAPIGGHLLDVIAQYVHLTAISLDGAPATHNEMRGTARAFDYVERAVERLSALKLQFGFSYCVSRKSLADMPWAYEFAASAGAKLLQFHPFAATGRGSQMAEDNTLSSADFARLYVLSKLLEAHKQLAVQLDIAPVELIRDLRGDYLVLSADYVSDLSLGDMVSPLVIDETGMMYPFSYGIDPRLAIAKVDANLRAAIMAYKVAGWHRLRLLLDRAFAALDSYNGEFIDWFYHLVETSRTLDFSLSSESILLPDSLYYE
ncbi:MAG: radical SAM protein [Anaerolineae bacterium]|nr:radical SAM protein [Anaerolineae bacterium]